MKRISSPWGFLPAMRLRRFLIILPHPPGILIDARETAAAEESSSSQGLPAIHVGVRK